MSALAAQRAVCGQRAMGLHGVRESTLLTLFSFLCLYQQGTMSMVAFDCNIACSFAKSQISGMRTVRPFHAASNISLMRFAVQWLRFGVMVVIDSSFVLEL